MYAGKIVEYSDVRTIFYRSAHPYTKGLLESIPKLEATEKRLVPIKGNPPSLVKLSQGCSFNPRCNYRKDICLKEVPVLRELGSNHKVACHLTEEEIEKTR